MAIDVTSFSPTNTIDTCAIWNLLSSKKLVSAAKCASCNFAATGFVVYEALHKPRTAPSEEDLELKDRLRVEQKNGFVGDCELTIDDLQDIAMLERRKRLGKGELSSIAFARKAGMAFMTDDQKARKLACEIMESEKVQTCPHLFGWLIFRSTLGDGDKDSVIDQHEQYGGELRPHLEAAYVEALRCRCMR